jgi:hypothetical protein
MEKRLMIKAFVFALCASAFVVQIADGQMKYSRSRSQQSPTPTASPTPQPTASPAANSRRPAPPQYYSSQPKPTASLPVIPARTSNVPLQPKSTPVPMQRTGVASIQSRGTAITSQRAVTGPNQPRMLPTPAPVPQQPTPPPVPPPDIQGYLDRQLASSKDRKFHLTANGKDLPLTPFHVWRQKEIGPNSTSTCVDMRSDEGRVYDIDFVTTGKDVTGVRVHRINGETVR